MKSQIRFQFMCILFSVSQCNNNIVIILLQKVSLVILLAAMLVVLHSNAILATKRLKVANEYTLLI